MAGGVVSGPGWGWCWRDAEERRVDGGGAAIGLGVGTIVDRCW